MPPKRHYLSTKDVVAAAKRVITRNSERFNHTPLNTHLNRQSSLTIVANAAAATAPATDSQYSRNARLHTIRMLLQPQREPTLFHTRRVRNRRAVDASLPLACTCLDRSALLPGHSCWSVSADLPLQAFLVPHMDATYKYFCSTITSYVMQK